MSDIRAIVRNITLELSPQFEARLREQLSTQSKEWLIDQIVRLSLDAHSVAQADNQRMRELKARKRAERVERLQKMALDRHVLLQFLADYQSNTRENLIATGYLLETAPEKGTELITEHCRSKKGSDLLLYAKDLLFGLLFGDDTTNTRLERREREILTVTLPRFKSQALDFMKAATEFSALGTWQDPESVSNDARAENIILEVEFGEIEGELIGAGIVQTLSLINNLEVNEQILYARMINVEQTTLLLQ